jgi:hypothetical protein
MVEADDRYQMWYFRSVGEEDRDYALQFIWVVRP